MQYAHWSACQCIGYFLFVCSSSCVCMYTFIYLFRVHYFISVYHIVYLTFLYHIFFISIYHILYHKSYTMYYISDMMIYDDLWVLTF